MKKREAFVMGVKRGLVFLSDHWKWHGLCLLPWGVWLWRGLRAAWPGVGRQPLYQGLGRLLEDVGRLALVGLLLLWLAQYVAVAGDDGELRGLSLGSVMSAARLEVREDESGWYHVRLRGEFELRVDV